MNAPRVLYNEWEPYVCDWLENLSSANQIAPGKVDRRSIVDLRAEDVAGYDQFHAFAGLGGWSYALRLAGISDDFNVWSGSAPCQPFSVAGKGGGVDDARHLWPEFFRLIRECRPAAVCGEQVGSAAGLAWLDAVFSDLENIGYACWAVNIPSSSVGAPHIRQRLYFCAFRVADADGGPCQQGSPDFRRRTDRGDAEPWAGSGSSSTDGLANGASSGWEPGRAGEESESEVESGRLRPVGGLANNNNNRREILGGAGLPEDADAQSRNDVDGCSSTGGLGDPSSSRGGRDPRAVSGAETKGGSERSGDGDLPYVVESADAAGGLGNNNNTRSQGHSGDGDGGSQPRRVRAEQAGSIGAAGATRGFWADADWLFCRDGKWRPVEPGTFPLAHGSPTRVGPAGTLETQPRVGKLKAYGNAINVRLAAEFISAAFEAFTEVTTRSSTPGA